MKIHPSAIARFAYPVLVDGVEFFTAPEIPDLSRAPYFRHTVTSTDRLDLLALKYYGDSRFDWLIACANDIRDMTFDIHVGMELKILTPDYVKSTLRRIR